jgi:hypothetical protein
MRIHGKKRTLLSVSAISAFVLIFILVAPVVPFSASITLPGNLKPGGLACHSIDKACFEKYSYPPAQITGSSTVSYSLLGVGPQPYPREKLVVQGNESALIYFKRASIEAAELYYAPIASLNPPGVVRIENQSLDFSENDLLKFSATVMNISPESMTLYVRITGSGGAFGGNNTIDGINWIGAQYAQCAPSRQLLASLEPDSRCVASYQAESNPDRNATQLHFTVEAVGKVGGRWFLYQQQFVLANPYTGHVNAGWVAAFMRSVNSARNGTSLHEDKSLDDFAQIRFKASLSNFTIANYGFEADYHKFFPAIGPQVGEDVLFTGKYLPTQYASVLSQTAPGHWSVLMDATYSKFGYFVGDGPTVVAREPCTVTEFPSGGLNETAYLASHGCGYDIVQGPWVVIEVGN